MRSRVSNNEGVSLFVACIKPFQLLVVGSHPQTVVFVSYIYESISLLCGTVHGPDSSLIFVL